MIAKKVSYRQKMMFGFFVLAFVFGFFQFGPVVDKMVTSEIHDRYELAGVGVTDDYFLFMAYKYADDGSIQLILGKMAKEGACVRPAVHESWHYDVIDVYKFGIYFHTYECLYL